MHSLHASQASPFQSRPPTWHPSFRPSLVCHCSSRKITAQRELLKDSHHNKVPRGNCHIKPWWASRGLLHITSALPFWAIRSGEVQCSCLLLPTFRGEGTTDRLCHCLLSGLCFLIVEKDYSFFRKKMPPMGTRTCMNIYTNIQAGNWIG